MGGVNFLLLFFIIYDFIVTCLFLYVWLKTLKRSNEKDDLIDDLNNELAKIHKK